ncbi:hypothetical protein HU200_006406 [Digitaria exilis]|uniref:Neprosin PEP catalytic domain-containing protein n=1 Tax=Digitaria exilis TaxID=1010633 RepID=A0A835FSK9_9POAL|nr:hypothetical protein HU200_006406 [Digitaria exilis]
MDQRILVVAVAALSLLLVTDASRSYPWIDQKLDAPTNETNLMMLRGLIGHISPQDDGGSAADPTYVSSIAPLLCASSDGYYGFIATLDVYGFTLKHGQGTAGACPGFQPEKGASIAPGDAIAHVSTPKGDKQKLKLKIVKDGGASGDWLVHLGLNREPELIGRFPRSLFTGGFADRAPVIRFGGMVTAPVADPAPMGSGYLPAEEGAASVSDIKLIGRDGRATPVTVDLPKLESKPDAYAVSSVVNGHFFYGGTR